MMRIAIFNQICPCYNTYFHHVNKTESLYYEKNNILGVEVGGKWLYRNLGERVWGVAYGGGVVNKIKHWGMNQ